MSVCVKVSRAKIFWWPGPPKLDLARPSPFSLSQRGAVFKFSFRSNFFISHYEISRKV